MAKTGGQGNPHWTRDEIILALELYQDSGGKIPSKLDPRVVRLSKLLRTMPHARSDKENETFRNPDGVGFKLQNIRKVATGKGLGNVSEMDRRVVNELGSDPATVKRLADRIRAALTTAEEPADEDVDPDEEFFEGALLTREHKRRERKPALRKRLLQIRKKKAVLSCDMCGCVSHAPAPDLSDAIFEAHHIIPIGTTGPRSTRIADMALLCANCHRVLHRAIARQRQWLSIEEGQKLIRGPRP